MAASLENNKILAAVLTAGIIASGAGVTSRILYHPEVLEEPAYVIAVPEEGSGGGDEGGGEEEMSVAALLASADVGAGETGSKKCTACHSFDEGGDNGIGPNLYGIVGRDIAAVSGFAYSDALNGIEGAWDYEALDAFIANPKDYAPGTKMAYAGMRSGEDRADLILYLRSLAADPLPLPEAEAVETGAAEESESGEGEADAAAEGAAAEDATEETAAATDGAAQEAVEVADEVAAESEETTDEMAEAAEGAAETAADAAETVTDEVDAAAEAVEDTVEETAETAESAGEEAAEQAEDTAAAVSDAAGDAAETAEETVAATGDAATDAAGSAGAAASGLVAMIADGDVAEGENVAKKCKACHVFEEGGQNKLGPALWGIVDKDIASHEGFNYSDALSELEGSWTYEELDQFLAAPKSYVPGTKMVFAGIKKEEDRADLIAYLRTLAAEPAPLN